MKKLLILLLLFLVLPSKAFAQNTQNQNANQSIKSVLNISPIIIDTTLQKGKTQTFQIKVSNLLSQPLGINADIENFFPTDQGDEGNFQNNSPLIGWSTLSESNFIMDQGKDKTITMSIKTPANLKDGGYYDVVFFTPFYTKPIDNSSPTVLTKIGILVLGTVGKINYTDLKNKTSISELNLNPVYENRNLDFSFRVQNSYFTHFSAKPFLTVFPLFGNDQTTQLTQKTILPGTSRLWTQTFTPDSNSIFYKVHLAVSVGQGNYIYRDGFFFVLPIKEIILLLAALLIIFVIKVRGKQIKKALRILLKGR